MKIRIELYGELYEQKCDLYYQEKILYSGYTDNLVTSVNGHLEIKLNYGTMVTTSIIVKRLGNTIFWVPINNVNLNERYINVLISIEEMGKVWQKLGYKLEDDICLINNVTNKDLKLLWIANSGMRLYIESINEISKIVENNIIGFNNDSEEVNDYINYLLKEDWDELEVSFTNQVDLTKDKLVAYIDYLNIVTEWVPLIKGEGKYNIINLGSNYTIKLINKC